MPKLISKPPQYRLHKPSGQAIVLLAGRMHYLGPYGTPASRAEYDRLVGNWLAQGRPRAVRVHDLTIAEAALAYLRHAETYYRKNGRQTSSVAGVKLAIGWLVELFGDKLAAEFEKRDLKAIQAAMIAADKQRRDSRPDAGPSGNIKPRKAGRRSINATIDAIRRLYRWLAEESMIPASVYLELKVVSRLRKGRSDARETPGKRPVDDATIDATLPYLPPVVADMVRLHRLTGMRPSELCAIRPGDVDRSGETWVYTPAEHKTEHHDHERPIQIGPRGQEILRPYLLRPADAYCLSPQESERVRREEQHANRKTPLDYGNAPGTNRVDDPKRPARERYDRDSYGRAVKRACERARSAARQRHIAAGGDPAEAVGPRDWSPNALRHTFLTQARRECGLEAAQVLAGHARADITQTYAQRDNALAASAIKRIG